MSERYSQSTPIQFPARRSIVLGGAAVAAGLLLGASPAEAAGSKYNRNSAVKFARSMALDKEPYLFGNNCTWFVSRALWAGGLPKSKTWTPWTLNPGLIASRAHIARGGGPSKAAASADHLKSYLVRESKIGTIRELDFGNNNVKDAQLGDVIFYDWDNGADGFVDHAMIITAFSEDSNGRYKYPLVSGQSRGVLDQGWTWSGGRSGWIAEKYKGSKDKARAYLVRIAN
ncbi:amidase domain-containing protein [Arthrobacter sp. CJ23]|uniref:amidase domain-containing protein n=1 Tax=Arthrobacter sp. CJ23 TaxID=2972479 RepID=UPI00215C8538|nr:amidase domain-containing protein [Arthrobacter sp. CJ23]UVJ39032.1 amidase domain-containing protein [Arthrobacter sp. CJ23]